MQICEEIDGDRLIVSLQGHLDTAAAPSFEQRLLAVIEQGARRVVVDCGGVDYVNSAGLKTFLLAAKRLDTVKGKFVLCALKPNVSLILETIGFDRIMTILPTREAALQSVGGEATAA